MDIIRKYKKTFIIIGVICLLFSMLPIIGLFTFSVGSVQIEDDVNVTNESSIEISE